MRPLLRGIYSARAGRSCLFQTAASGPNPNHLCFGTWCCILPLWNTIRLYNFYGKRTSLFANAISRKLREHHHVASPGTLSYILIVLDSGAPVNLCSDASSFFVLTLSAYSPPFALFMILRPRRRNPKAILNKLLQR